MFLSSVRVKPRLLLLQLITPTVALILCQCANVVHLTALLILLVIIVDVIDSSVEFGGTSFYLKVVAVSSGNYNRWCLRFRKNVLE